MKKDIRLAICLVIIILLVILCIYRLLADKEIEKEAGGDNNPTEAVITPRTIADPKNENGVLHGLKYYTVNMASMTNETVETAIGSKVSVTPRLISEFIIDALEDEEIELELKDISVENGLCIIDFTNSIRDISGNDSKLEKLILDAFAMSIIDNCNEVESVSFRIAGEAYRTGSVQLQDKEVYLKR